MKCPSVKELNRLDGKHTIEVARVAQWTPLAIARRDGRLSQHVWPMLNPRLEQGEHCIKKGWPA